MGLLERIKNAVRTNLAEIADRLEDPEERLDQLIGRMESDLDDARLELGAAVREIETLNQQAAEASTVADEMERKARLALERDDEELAREALRRVEMSREHRECLLREAALQDTTTTMLRQHVVALERKLEQARRQREMVVARRRLAEAQQAVTRRASWADSEVSAALQARIDELDAQTQANDQVLGDAADLGLPSEDRIEERLNALKREVSREREPGEEG